jgi:hypothetical protein
MELLSLRAKERTRGARQAACIWDHHEYFLRDVADANTGPAPVIGRRCTWRSSAMEGVASTSCRRDPDEWRRIRDDLLGTAI